MISPIPTKYKGYNFRSRLEARWAVFFDNMKIQYHYEIEGFPLESGLYLPDFYLPQFKMFAEVKPCEFNDREYDHLFNVDDESGTGTKIIPFNNGDNALVAAEKYCKR